MASTITAGAAGSIHFGDFEWQEIWKYAGARLADQLRALPDTPVSSKAPPSEIRSALAAFDFTQQLAPESVIDFALEGLRRWQTQTNHPGYWGLYVPAPSSMGVIADAIAAAFNPQLANWSHSPFAVEVERHLIQAFSSRLGFPASACDGTLTSGGAEANHTAILTALNSVYPGLWEIGMRGLPENPTLYCSAAAHDSWLKAARACGFSRHDVRVVAVDDRGRIRPGDLDDMLSADVADGRRPVLVVATAGSTSEGAIDPLADIATIARNHNVWFHVDAAWAGALIASPQLRSYIGGMEAADSVTCDAHKWLSVPMGAGIYLTRHRGALRSTFDVTTDYMPRMTDDLDVVDPYRASMQWSRRFIGLKIFMTLAVCGWDGYAKAIESQVALGNRMRRVLSEHGWRLMNETELPVVCVVENDIPGPSERRRVQAIVDEVLREGRAWVSAAELIGRGSVVRCCVSNMRSTDDDVDVLVAALNRARVKAGRVRAS